MKQSNYFIIIAILCFAQALISNYLLFSQYVLISLLPVLVMSLPPRYNTVQALLLAFVIGFVADFIGTGALGLTCVALLPVALLRLPILRAVSEDDYLTYPLDTPFAHQSTSEMVLSCVFSCLLFFLVYVPFDDAGTRSLGFALLRILFSSIVSVLLCVLLSQFLFRRLA